MRALEGVFAELDTIRSDGNACRNWLPTIRKITSGRENEEISVVLVQMTTILGGFIHNIVPHNLERAEEEDEDRVAGQEE
jgi:hypothetical protein